MSRTVTYPDYRIRCQWLAAGKGLLLIEDRFTVKAVDRLLTVKYTANSYKSLYRLLKQAK